MNDIDLSRVDLNLLTAFEVLYQEKSVSRAAERLYLGQSAMSHTLNRLRKLFDDVLLERYGHKMRSTRKADELYRAVHSVLSVIRDTVLDQSAFDPATWNGTVRIGINDYCEFVYGQALFSRVRSVAPEVQVSFITVNRSNSIELLKAGKLDIAMGHWPAPIEDISQQELYIEKHVCLFDNKVLKVPLPISFQDYIDTPHALVTPDGQLSSGVDKTLADMGAGRTVALGCTRFMSLLTLLRGERLLSIVPETLSYMDQSTNPLTHCEPPLPVSDFSISLAWRASDSSHPVLCWLQALVAEVALEERQRLYK